MYISVCFAGSDVDLDDMDEEVIEEGDPRHTGWVDEFDFPMEELKAKQKKHYEKYASQAVQPHLPQ